MTFTKKLAHDKTGIWDVRDKTTDDQVGSCTKSIRNDLSKRNTIVSEESRRVFFFIDGQHELIELKQTSATIQ